MIVSQVAADATEIVGEIVVVGIIASVVDGAIVITSVVGDDGVIVSIKASRGRSIIEHGVTGHIVFWKYEIIHRGFI